MRCFIGWLEKFWRLSGRTRATEEISEVGESEISWGVSKKIRDGEWNED